MNIQEELNIIKCFFARIQNAVGKAKEIEVRVCCSPSTPAEAKAALSVLLDPSIVTHVGSKSFQKRKDIAPNKAYDSIFRIVEDLSNAPAASDQMIANIHAALRTVDDLGLRLFGYAFLCKDISLGVTAKTVNKALGYEFIPEFRCMLSNKYFEHADKVEGKHFYLTEKIDGIRLISKVTPDEVKLFSRQGVPIEGLYDIEEELLVAANKLNKSFVVDGELLVFDRKDMPSKEQYKRTTMIVRKEGRKNGIKYNVFDILDYDAFENRQCEMPYYQRRQRLETYFPNGEYVYVKPLPILYHGNDTSEILHHLNVQRALDHEGVMINLADEPYRFTRTNALLKVKVMQDCDLEIIGVEEGNGKFAGTLGALVVDYKGNPVGVGSGITDDVRRMIWNDPSKYIGRVATIQYFEETNDKDGKESLRFPVFKELREEGKEVSYE